MTRLACFAVTGSNLHTRKTKTVFIVSCVSDPQTLTAFHSTVQHLRASINITSKLGEERRGKKRKQSQVMDRRTGLTLDPVSTFTKHTEK